MTAPTTLQLPRAEEHENSAFTNSDRIAETVRASTTTLLCIGFGIGSASALLSAVPPLVAHAPTPTVVLTFLWCAPWLIGTAFPNRSGLLLQSHWWAVVIASALALLVSVVFTGGFDSYLKTSINWLPWVGAVLFAPRVVIKTAALISITLALAFVVTGENYFELFSGANRYTAASDLLNPLMVGLVALSLAGVFRRTFSDIVPTLRQFWSGDWRASGLQLEVAPGRPLLDVPGGTAGAQAVDSTHETTLTVSEREIVDQLAAGLTPQQIALKSRRRAGTVYEHIASAKAKVGARTIAHLITLAWRPV